MNTSPAIRYLYRQKDRAETFKNHIVLEADEDDVFRRDLGVDMIGKTHRSLMLQNLDVFIKHIDKSIDELTELNTGPNE